MERGAWTSQIFELVPRWFPNQVQRARKLDLAAARRALLKRYVNTVVAATPQMIVRVFGWPREQVLATIDDLVARRVCVRSGDWIVENDVR
jgi:hypothetical protein